MATVEEKAKAYDVALEKARQIHNADRVSGIELTTCEEIFPELCESEDERIRKELIEYFRWNVKQILNDFSNKECIAWLEKQGENTYNKELSELLHKVICRFINDPNIPYTEREKVSMEIIPYVERLEKQGKQKPQRMISAGAKEAMYDKPAWSEEDEDRLNSCVDAINAVYKWDSMIAWLKSLKERYTWKPSEELMEYLAKAILTLGNEGDNKTSAILYELRTDLKKLK